MQTPTTAASACRRRSRAGAARAAGAASTGGRAAPTVPRVRRPALGADESGSTSWRVAAADQQRQRALPVIDPGTELRAVLLERVVLVTSRPLEQFVGHRPPRAG